MKSFSLKQREAVRRLLNNNDFGQLKDYLEESLKETKKNLLNANDDNFKKLQGTGIVLDQLLKDIESSSK
jgi:hypothetical protein